MRNPNEYMVNPKEFGWEPGAAWKTVSMKERAGLEAAKLQHECSIKIRELAKERYGSVRSYGIKTGQGYQRLGHILRGNKIMRFDDLGLAVNHLGLSVRFASRYSCLLGKETNTIAGHSDRRNSVGAFYTPDDVASYMIEHLRLGKKASVLEPSFGDGAFLSAALANGISSELIVGVETDEQACNLAIQMKLLEPKNTMRINFFDYMTEHVFDTVVGNPPYVRLRTLDEDDRQKALDVATSHSGVSFGEESSLWIPFVVKATDHLNEGGSIAFVLPYEITYVKYARSLWSYLGEHFGELEVVRVHDRIFAELMQDVVLFFGKSFGAKCSRVSYRCYETLEDLKFDNASVNKMIPIEDAAKGDRVFQRAMIPNCILQVLHDEDVVVRCDAETAFHIGYVCGNKGFFHPSKEVAEDWSLPGTSLLQTAMSSRRLKGFPLETGKRASLDTLWLPENDLTDPEKQYVTHGETLGVHRGYKCRIRNPWWKVPMVKKPDILMSVFSDAPRLMINDAGWTFSNSILGGDLAEGISSAAFAETWYTVLTLLSIETEIHSLGGGVLVAVPNEANSVHKLSSANATEDPARLQRISDALEANAIDEAYHAGDALLTERFGAEFVDAAWKTVALLRSWRKRI